MDSDLKETKSYSSDKKEEEVKTKTITSSSEINLNLNQVSQFLTKENLETLSKAVISSPLFSLFLITTLLNGPLQDIALYGFISIYLLNANLKL